MKNTAMKMAVLMITGLMIVGTPSVSANATSTSGSLPSAGFSLVVDGGNSVGDVKEEVKGIVDTATDSSNASADAGMIQAAVNDTIDFNKEIIGINRVMTSKDAIKEDVKEDFSNFVIAQVNDYVNVRDLPDENEGKIIGKLYNNSVGNYIEETDNGWIKIESGNCVGYVKAEFCVTGDDAIALAEEVGTLIATVNTTTLKVREEPGLDASVIGLVPIADELTVSEKLDGWVKVDIEEGEGYVSLDYVELHTEFVTAESKEEEEARLAKEKAAREKANKAARDAAAAADAGASTEGSSAAVTASGSGAGSDVANYALQFVGNPYVYGGSSLTNGTDCSGFVMSVYGHFGVSLPHSSASDRSQGYDVGGISNAQPGDIVCYSGHVAIYIGNGQIVHASTSKTGIIVSDANYRQPICVRRIF